MTFSVLEPRSLDLGDISKPWSNLCLCSEEIQNLLQNVLPWVVLWLTISKFTMYCSWKYPHSPMKGFFLVWTDHLSGHFGLASYFPLKIVLLETPLPLGILVNLPWGGFGIFIGTALLANQQPCLLSWYPAMKCHWSDRAMISWSLGRIWVQ